jgi:hypothetical protein
MTQAVRREAHTCSWLRRKLSMQAPGAGKEMARRQGRTAPVTARRRQQHGAAWTLGEVRQQEAQGWAVAAQREAQGWAVAVQRGAQGWAVVVQQEAQGWVAAAQREAQGPAVAVQRGAWGWAVAVRRGGQGGAEQVAGQVAGQRHGPVGPEVGAQVRDAALCKGCPLWSLAVGSVEGP